MIICAQAEAARERRAAWARSHRSNPGRGRHRHTPPRGRHLTRHGAREWEERGDKPTTLCPRAARSTLCPPLAPPHAQARLRPHAPGCPFAFLLPSLRLACVFVFCVFLIVCLFRVVVFRCLIDLTPWTIYIYSYSGRLRRTPHSAEEGRRSEVTALEIAPLSSPRTPPRQALAWRFIGGFWCVEEARSALIRQRWGRKRS
jgi:hypothetical protein